MVEQAPASPEANSQKQELSAVITTSQAMDALNWSESAFDLDLDAVARQVALNSVVQSYQHDHLKLAILPELEVMLKPGMERQIKQAIEHKFEVSLTLEFNSLPSLDVETPHQTQLRKLEQERLNVIQQIYQDPVVQQLKSVFGAELIEKSVKKRSKHS